MTTERFDVLIIGIGEGGKYLAWTLAEAGLKTALVERRPIGGSCPNIACLPSKNLIHSAKEFGFAGRAKEFGLAGEPLANDMKGVLRRKQKMVDGLLAMHIDRFRTSGTELIMGEAEFIGERTAEVKLNAGGNPGRLGREYHPQPRHACGYPRCSWTRGSEADDTY